MFDSVKGAVSGVGEKITHAADSAVRVYFLFFCSCFRFFSFFIICVWLGLAVLTLVSVILPLEDFRLTGDNELNNESVLDVFSIFYFFHLIYEFLHLIYDFQAETVGGVFESAKDTTASAYDKVGVPQGLPNLFRS